MNNKYFNAVRFERENIIVSVNATEKDFNEVVKSAVQQTNFDKVKLYSFDLREGSATETVVALRYNHTEVKKFAAEYIKFWYALEYIRLQTLKAKVSAMITEDDDEQDIKDLVLKRAGSIEDTLKSFCDAENSAFKTCPYTVKMLVFADRELKDKDFPEAVFNSFKAVKSSLDKYSDLKDKADDFADKSEKSKEVKDYNTSCKNAYIAYKAELDKFCQTIWEESEGCILPYVFKANLDLCNKVYRLVYGGIHRSKGDEADCRFHVSYKNSKELIKEVIRFAFMKIQFPPIEVIEPNSALDVTPDSNDSDE